MHLALLLFFYRKNIASILLSNTAMICGTSLVYCLVILLSNASNTAGDNIFFKTCQLALLEAVYLGQAC